MSENDKDSNIPKEWLLQLDSTSKSSEQIGSSSWEGSCEPSPQVSFDESCSVEVTHGTQMDTIAELESTSTVASTSVPVAVTSKSPTETNPWAITPDASKDQDDGQISLMSAGSFPKSAASLSDTKQETTAAIAQVTVSTPAVEDSVAPPNATTAAVQTMVMVMPAQSTGEPATEEEGSSPVPTNDTTQSSEHANDHVQAMVAAANAFVTQNAGSEEVEDESRVSRVSSLALSEKDEEKSKAESEKQEGGRLWLAAVKSVEDQPASPRGPATPYTLQIDTVAGCNSSVDDSDSEDEDAFLFTANLARKRVRAVQLLAFGVIGFVVGFCGSVLVLSSCNFVTAETQVGDGYEVSNSFDLHYGLWKYSPLDSAFNNYSYCYAYDEKHTSYTPWISRIGGSSALGFATYSLAVLWFYLIRGSATYFTWKLAVIFLVLAGFCQASTFGMLLDNVCTSNTTEQCRLSGIAYLSGAISFFWFALAIEMQVNMPVSQYVERVTGAGENIVSGLELHDLQTGAKSYLTRPIDDSYKRTDGSLPSLNQIRRKKGSTPSVASMSRKASDMGSYKSPSFNLV